MPGNAAVKNTARVILKGMWPKLIACTFLGIAVAFIGIYAISAVSLLVFGAVWMELLALICYFLLIFMPLSLGILRFVWRQINDADDDIEIVFYYFSSAAQYFKSLLFTVTFGIKLLISAVLAFFPYLAVRYALYSSADFLSEQMEMRLLFLSAIFWLCGMIFFIILSVRYYISPLLFVCCSDIEVSEVMHLSKLISRKTAGSYIVLVLGMIGWILLSVFGITMIYTVPYLLLTYAVHCRYAIYYYNHRIRLNEETSFPEFRSSF